MYSRMLPISYHIINACLILIPSLMLAAALLIIAML